MRLSPSGNGTRIDYDYEVAVSGKAASIGGRLMQGASALVIGQFFDRFGKQLGAPVHSVAGASPGLFARIASWFASLFGSGK